jgi:CBS domain-containing protein
MSRSVISAEARVAVAEVAELMRTHRIHRVVIVEEGKLRGLVSTMDIIGVVAEGKLS